MATFFLMIIYLAFISLGLPDSLLGAAWPVMQSEFDAPLETAGMLFMIIAGSTIVSSLASGPIIKRLGTGNITLISCIMTAGALLGLSYAPSLLWLILFSVPLGLGAGAVDAGLNNYVATHYKAQHMSWLHCFWGVGATLGPIIMSQHIANENGWRDGYIVIFAVQVALVVLLFFTLPLWKRVAKTNSTDLIENQEDTQVALHDEANKKIKPLQVKGVKLALVTFLFYCGVEATMGLWGSSFLVNVKLLPADVAARWVSMFYAGITVGRLVTGFIAYKVSNRTLIRVGQATTLAGALLLVLPLPTICAFAGFIMVGLGCAPIFPCMLHETPVRFGKEHSQSIMGYQMAVAYTGSTLLPPLLGWFAAHTTIAIFPFFIAAYGIVMLVSSEKINAFMKARLLQNS
ncbi:MFS transporter [Paenibacillus sp. sgz302251]|uniref:MFS transporter n=1 Tax=Paenibacillus sp. sgz302251 TaxID=3414493 RepID=UPI003C7A3676